MNASPTLGALATALAKAQAEMPHAPKSSKNTHLKNEYADLPTVIETVRPVLNRHGISVLQRAVDSPPGTVAISTTLLHDSGEWIADEGIVIPFAEQRGVNLAQSAGSALTYARRYGLAAIVSLAQGDDDGRDAGAPQEAAQQPTPLTKKQAADLRALAIEAGADEAYADKYVSETTRETLAQRTESVRAAATRSKKLAGV